MKKVLDVVEAFDYDDVLNHMIDNNKVIYDDNVPILTTEQLRNYVYQNVSDFRNNVGLEYDTFDMFSVTKKNGVVSLWYDCVSTCYNPCKHKATTIPTISEFMKCFEMYNGIQVVEKTLDDMIKTTVMLYQIDDSNTYGPLKVVKLKDNLYLISYTLGHTIGV